jgi:hypothetical protein
MIAESKLPDRRRSERFPIRDSRVAFKKSGLFSFLNNTLTVDNYLVNISQHGAQFLAGDYVPPGATLVLQVDVPMFLGGLCFKAQVVWSIKLPRKKAYRVGVKFLKTDRETAQRLETLRKDVFFRTTKNHAGRPAKVG